MAKTRSGKKDVDSYTIKGTKKIVRVGDCVLMRPPDTSKPPYVARVDKFELDSRNNLNVRVRWYYRPEESIGGRRQFHGANELFLSDHRDLQSAHTIEGKCVVHPFDDYIKLENVGVEDYYCRFQYKAVSGEFTPDSVAVYCKCETPYNPDVFMVQCEGCQDWYHLACVGMTTEEAKTLDHFVCSDCSSNNDLEKTKATSPVSSTIDGKEKLNAKTLHNKGVPAAIEELVPPAAIEELCDNLNGNVVSNVLECAAPDMDPLSLAVNNVQSGNVEAVQVGSGKEDTTNKESVGDDKSVEDQVYSEHGQSSHLEELERREDIGLNFTDEMHNGSRQEPIKGHGDTQVPTSGIGTSEELQNTDTKIVDTVSMNRKRKQPIGSSSMMNHPLENMVEMHGPADQALELDSNTHNSFSNTETTVNSAKRVMNILNHMDGLEAGSSLWCFAVYLLEDPFGRECFLEMEGDASRLAWIKFMYNMKVK